MFEDYLTLSAGVAIAVVLPALTRFVKSAFGVSAQTINRQVIRQYLALLVFSLITGLIVLAVLRQTNGNGDISFSTALLAGFAWESTIEKLWQSS